MPAPDSTAPVPPIDKPPRPRRRIPLSLRMIVAILLLLGFAGALIIGVPAYPQYLATREIERIDAFGDSLPGRPGVATGSDAEQMEVAL